MRTDVDDVGDIADRPQRLLKNQSVIRWIGLGEFRPLFRLLCPREFAAVDDGAAEVDAMAADKLRRGIDDDVKSVFDRPEQRRRQRRVVG